MQRSYLQKLVARPERPTSHALAFGVLGLLSVPDFELILSLSRCSPEQRVKPGFRIAPSAFGWAFRSRPFAAARVARHRAPQHQTVVSRGRLPVGTTNSKPAWPGVEVPRLSPRLWRRCLQTTAIGAA